MTSEERHEARYQRRVAKRRERRMARSKNCGDFEDVLSYANLYRSGLLCCRGVGWKNSTQSYRANIVTNTERTRQQLLSGKYKGKGFYEFDIVERGKKRHIRSVHISERAVQRTLCDQALIPVFQPALIYDNGASMRGKGISFAIRRVTCHLQRHFRKHGNAGYVLTYDFSSYFDTAIHEPVKQELDRRVHDDRVRSLANQCLDAFGPVGYGLGSQISQIAAIMLPNKLDHVIKQELGIKGYARYMDDGYLIHESKAHLKHCLRRIYEVCQELGITLNPKKVRIRRLSDGFDFLKVRFRLTTSGKVVRRGNRESIRIMRRKLKKFKDWLDHGRVVHIHGETARKAFPLQDICSAYASWRSHMAKGHNYWRIKRMDDYFMDLFGLDPRNKGAWRLAANGGQICIGSKMLPQAA